MGAGKEQPIPTGDDITEAIRGVLREYARIPGDIVNLRDDADLFRAGMTSHASVSLMLALEEAFDIEFPDHMLKRASFESIAAIRVVVGELTTHIAA